MTHSALRVQHLAADLLGLSALERGILSGTPQPSLIAPRSLVGWQRPDRDSSSSSREALARELEQKLAAYQPSVAVLDRVRHLRDRGTRVVVATARPGLLGGPLGNLWSGLHAIRLAGALEEQWSSPVLPVLWVAGDDEFLRDHTTAHVLDANFDRPRVALSLDPTHSNDAVGERPLRSECDGLASFSSQLRAHLGDIHGAERWIEMFALRDGESLSQSTLRVLLQLLGRCGLIVVEPRWWRIPAARALAQVVGNMASDELDGLPPNVRATAHAYRFDDAVPRPIHPGGDGFQYVGEPGSRRPSELAAEIVQDPERWAAGPALRHAVAHALLPVAAWICDTEELECIAHTPANRSSPSTVVPLLGATLIGPGEARSLERLDWSAAEALAILASSTSSEARSNAPASADADAKLAEKLRAEGERARAAILALRSEARDLDPRLDSSLRRSASRARRALDDLALRAERLASNQRGAGSRHRRRIEGSLTGGGLHQARGQPLFTAISRFGDAWIEPLLKEIDPLPTEHAAVFLGE